MMESIQPASEKAIATSTTASPEAGIEQADRSDHELLSMFQHSADANAFAVLVQRHHGMVFAVAKRMLGCPHAAEDVVQATFLVLVKDVRKIRKLQSFVSWLYGVAYRISARSVRQRARTTVSTLVDQVMVTADPLEELNAQFEQEIVFDALHRLPESVRAPLVLRYLKGKTNQQVAAELNLSETAVEGRLKRGRKQLRLQLARKGVTYGLGIGILSLVQREALATVLPELVSKTLATSLGAKTTVETTFETGHGHEITRMAEQEIFKMATTKLAGITALTGIAMGVIAAGWALAGDALTPINENLGSGNEVLISSATDQTESDRPSFQELSNSPQESSPAAKMKEPADPFAIPRDGSPVIASAKPSAKRRSVDHHSIESLSENELRILESLKKPANFDFFETRMEDVLAEISDNYELKIYIDPAAQRNAETPIRELLIVKKIRNISLESALDVILDSHQLTSIIKNEMLLITSKDIAKSTATTRLYPCPSDWPITNVELMETIFDSVSPESWEKNGGHGNISPVADGVVISAPQAIHRKVNGLYSQLQRLYTEDNR
ncbi:MAG: sigma-70 family RNA polymerase sigma factor [Pirellulaceae bacterium]|nr:sigma-70 family RNA polymerase sigma factor [Pirellulaceae bacterium]MDG2102598.1 sigma-70 family RNA polymerase sigma factor [Pirellulaceae bacterium]